MQTVGVLGRIDGLEDGVGVDMGRQRQLDDVTGAGVVLVELVDDGQQLVLRHRLRQITPDRVDAHLGAVAVLAGDVPFRSRVLPHQNGAEAGNGPGLPELGHRFGQFGFDLLRAGSAVENLCAHQYCSRPS